MTGEFHALFCKAFFGIFQAKEDDGIVSMIEYSLLPLLESKLQHSNFEI